MKSLDVQQSVDESANIDPETMSLTALADHIEHTHHQYVRSTLSRLAAMMGEIAPAHPEQDDLMPKVRATFRSMAVELLSHMMKEEMCLFPMIRQLEASDGPPQLRVGTIADPIRQMELEHDRADMALAELRRLTDDYHPPHWACDTYRTMLSDLRDLDQNMRVHIHKEDDVLFPRALELEARKCQPAAAT